MKSANILKRGFLLCLLTGFLVMTSNLYAQEKGLMEIIPVSTTSDTIVPIRIDPCAISIISEVPIQKRIATRKDTLSEKEAFRPTIHVNWDSLRTVHSPRRAGLYSAIFPGLGQVYNHQYIKVPFMLAGIGVATGVFIFNFSHYTTFRDAYRLRLNGNKTGDPNVDIYTSEGLKFLRDGYRKYVDYSVLGFAAVYLYNIIDAVVFGYLYDFNVEAPLAKVRFGPVFHQDQPYVGFGFTYNF